MTQKFPIANSNEMLYIYLSYFSNGFFHFREEDDGLEYHIVRGNRNGGYRNGGGGGQAEAADFWDDFNIHDPQSIYADKYSTQEETSGGGGGNYRQHQYKTPSIESAWGQRQV